MRILQRMALKFLYAQYQAIPEWPLLTPKSAIYSPKRDEGHPRYFNVGVPQGEIDGDSPAFSFSFSFSPFSVSQCYLKTFPFALPTGHQHITFLT